MRWLWMMIVALFALMMIGCVSYDKQACSVSITSQSGVQSFVGQSGRTGNGLCCVVGGYDGSLESYVKAHNESVVSCIPVQ